jgi:hypothetical protein
MADHDRPPRFPTVIQHKHGLFDWAPMMPERSAETIVPGEPPTERIYRCQSIGCDAVVRIDAAEVTESGPAG